ncbi:Ferric reductase transmembrane component-like domain [Trinorchestia longiramus]|nr:Ferric reductase transmembrane component-like domain [Trinorchestia longiramus]
MERVNTHESSATIEQALNELPASMARQKSIHGNDVQLHEENTRGPSHASEVHKGNVGMIGSGDYGRALAGKMAQCGYKVQLGSRNPDNEQIKKMLESKPGTSLVSQEEAIASSNVLVVAVGGDHYSKLPVLALKGKILIDVANRTRPRPEEAPSIAEALQNLVPDAHVVKAFNVLSAYALENSTVQSAKQVPVASNSPDAKRQVLELVRSLGYSPVDYGDLSRARDIEDIPIQLLPQWRVPAIFVAVLWLLHFVVLVLKFQICAIVSGHDTPLGALLANLGLLNFNRATAITALWTLCLCYLPGVLGAYLQLWRGTKYKRFPTWLDNWLRSRKQLGLLMLALASIHTILGASVWSSHYDKLVFEKPTVALIAVRYNDTATAERSVTLHDSRMTWQGELFMTTGTLAMFVTAVLGVSSLPSVGASLSWREFMFIQSKLGWLALLLATAHDGLLGFGFESHHYNMCTVMSGAQYALHLPLLTILLKLPLLLPCVDKHLQAIRSGHDRTRNKQKKIFVQPASETRVLRTQKRNGETCDLTVDVTPCFTASSTIHGSIILDDGSMTLNDCSMILDNDSMILDDSSMILDNDSMILDDGSMILNDGRRILDHGSMTLIQ